MRLDSARVGNLVRTAPSPFVGGRIQIDRKSISRRWRTDWPALLRRAAVRFPEASYDHWMVGGVDPSKIPGLADDSIPPSGFVQLVKRWPRRHPARANGYIGF